MHNGPRVAGAAVCTYLAEVAEARPEVTLPPHFPGKDHSLPAAWPKGRAAAAPPLSTVTNVSLRDEQRRGGRGWRGA